MLKPNDFVELDFIARIKEAGQVFDTTLLEEAEKANLLGEEETKEKATAEKKFKPFRLCIGQGMLVAGLDKALEGKETGNWYEIELQPRDAFGLRDPKLVKILSLRAFRERGINPAPGMVLNLDNMLAKIVTVSSGRVVVDFNNPLSGKAVIYKFKINRRIEDKNEKLEILMEFFLGKPEKINLQDKKAVIEFKIKFPEKIKEEFSKKVKEILSLDVEIKEVKETKQVEGKKEEKKE